MPLVDPHRTFQVAIVCGGHGPQRGESLASARALASELARCGHLPTLIDSAEMSPEAIEWPAYQICHVGIADDGEWHRRLQGRGIVHTGSSAEAVEIAASRASARQFLLRFDVPTPQFVLLRNSVSPVEAVARVASLGYPLLIRSDDRRVSHTRVVRSPDELLETLRELFPATPRVICERSLQGRAYSVVLQGEVVLPPVPTALPGDVSHSATQELSTHERQLLGHVASMTGVALGMSGLVQVEVVIDKHGRPWVLEANPLPALTEESVVARAAAAAGLSLAELCQWLVQDCLMVESFR